MIGRRSFTLGLSGLLIGGAARAAQPPMALTAPAATTAPLPVPGQAPPPAAAPQPAPAPAPAAPAAPTELVLPKEFQAEMNAAPVKKPKKRQPDIADIPVEQIPNHRQFMRDILTELAAYAKKSNPNFLILVKNAPELLIKEKREWTWEDIHDPNGTESGKYLPVGSIIRSYLRIIDGMVLDGAFVGGEEFGKRTSTDITAPLMAAAAALKKEGRQILSVDYAPKNLASSLYTQVRRMGATEYVDSEGDKSLSRFPGGVPFGENSAVISSLAQARNWAYLREGESFPTHASWIAALRDNNYDVIATDVFWRGGEAMTIADAKKLNQKALGSRRLVLADMSIGKARDTRFYWKTDWTVGNPPFLAARDPDDPSAMIVEYWTDEWKKILGLYMEGIMSYGMDGVIFSDIDVYRFFEERMPLE